MRPASEWAAWINSWTRTSAALHEDPPELADAAARRMADILTGADDLDDEDGRMALASPTEPTVVVRMGRKALPGLAFRTVGWLDVRLRTPCQRTTTGESRTRSLTG